MPSEPTPTTNSPAVAAGLALLKARDRHRSIVAATVEQVRPGLRPTNPNDGGNGASLPEPADTLGDLGAQLIDAGRFSALAQDSRATTAGADAPTRRAFDALSELLSQGEGVYEIHVGEGESLRDKVAAAFTSLGRAFGAARVIELAQTGRFDDNEHTSLLKGLPFERWNEAERQVAPPLLVHVAGGSLVSGGLADFLDGAVKIVLLCEGADAPLAPLASLITPGRFVLQTNEVAALQTLSAWAGPGIAALLPDDAARFVHDPTAGDSYFERIHVDALPDSALVRTVGQASAPSQRDALAHLASLTAETATLGEDDDRTPEDAENRLAAWLLKQARM